MWLKTIQQAKRLIKIVVGFTILLAGVIMLITPGPGWVAIALGLAILAAEFVWARRLLDHLKKHGGRLRDAVFPNNKPKTPAGQPSALETPKIPSGSPSVAGVANKPSDLTSSTKETKTPADPPSSLPN